MGERLITFERAIAHTLSPHGPAAQARTLEWARGFADHDALQSLIVADCGAYAALVAPHATAEQAQLISDYFAWLIVFDDRVGEGDTNDLKRHREDLSRCFAGHRPRYELTGRLVDIADRSARGDAFLAFLASVADYMRGCAEEQRHRASGVPPCPLTYAGFRSDTIGMRPVFRLLGLPPDTRTDSLEDTAVLACYLANDYFSCGRAGAGEDLFNAVAILSHHARVSRDAALDVVAAQHNLCVASIYFDPSSRERPPLLLDAVRGNAEWYATSRRYRP